MDLIGKTYKQRCKHQIDEWVKGNSIHNVIDNECCPDFSCCHPDLLQDLSVRETFKEVSLKAEKEDLNKEDTPFYDMKESMLAGFLGAGLSKMTDEKFIIISGNNPLGKELN